MHLRALTRPIPVTAIWLVLVVSAAAQTGAPPTGTKPKVPTALDIGGVLAGQLTAMKSRARGKGRSAPLYQLVSEPRRLPPPGGLCNLETGPETFQIVADNDAQASQLKKLIGKLVTLKVSQVVCAEEAGIISEAIVTKWNLVAP